MFGKIGGMFQQLLRTSCNDDTGGNLPRTSGDDDSSVEFLGTKKPDESANSGESPDSGDKDGKLPLVERKEKTRSLIKNELDENSRKEDKHKIPPPRDQTNIQSSASLPHPVRVTQEPILATQNLSEQDVVKLDVAPSVKPDPHPAEMKNRPRKRSLSTSSEGSNSSESDPGNDMEQQAKPHNGPQMRPAKVDVIELLDSSSEDEDGDGAGANEIDERDTPAPLLQHAIESPIQRKPVVRVMDIYQYDSSDDEMATLLETAAAREKLLPLKDTHEPGLSHELADSSDDEMATILETNGGHKKAPPLGDTHEPKSSLALPARLNAEERRRKRTLLAQLERHAGQYSAQRGRAVAAAAESPYAQRSHHSSGEKHSPKSDAKIQMLDVTKPIPKLSPNTAELATLDSASALEISISKKKPLPDTLRNKNSPMSDVSNTKGPVHALFATTTMPTAAVASIAGQKTDQPLGSTSTLDSTVPRSDQIPPGAASDSTPKPVFSRIVYGTSAKDRVEWWTDRVFDRERGSEFTFDDESVANDSHAHSGTHTHAGTDPFSPKSQKSTGTLDHEEFHAELSTEPFLDDEPLFKQKQLVKDVQTRNLERMEYELPPCMSIVKDMSTLEYDGRGKPVRTLVVYGGDDAILYKFRISVDKSGIPGAGLGAFLTYVGSLKLDPELVKINERLHEHRTHHIPQTAKTLTVARPNGLFATLKLTGQNLHGNDNEEYWPKTMLPLTATFQQAGQKRKRVKVHLLGEGLHEDPTLEALKTRGSDNAKRVGFLKAFLDTDFKPGQDVFDLQGNAINIGRYGPLRKEDRKPEGFFLCKSFIFQYAPSGYCFEVDEKFVNGEDQFIDITDDTTGLPHDDAKRQIPMYVNEVGHGLDRKQNIFSTDLDGRTIEYYFVLPDGVALKPGERVELLTNYFEGYERNRERGGYGLRNIHGHKKGGEDYPAYLQSRLTERADILNLAATVTMTTYDIMELVKEAIYDPIAKLLEQFVETGNCNLLSNMQLIALRRIFWLKARFDESVDHWEEKLREFCPFHELPSSLVNLNVGAIAQCKEVLGRIVCPEYITKQAMRDNRKLKESKLPISRVLRFEAIEEACFALRNRVLHPFDDSMWCPIACGLVRKLSYLVAEHMWPIEQSASSKEVLTVQKNLFQHFIEAGTVAAKEIREAAYTKDFKQLSFGSGLHKGMMLSGNLAKKLKHRKCSKAVFLVHSLTPKGYTAAIFDRIAYMDSLSAGLEDAWAYNEDTHLDPTDRFAMFSCYPVEDDAEGLGELGSIPRSVSRRTFADEINTTWYIIWQVLFLVEAYSRTYCGESDAVDELCSHFQVSKTAARFVISRGIKNKKDKSYKEFCRPEYVVRCKKVIDLPQTIGAGKQPSFASVSQSHKRKSRPSKKALEANWKISGHFLSSTSTLTESGTPRMNAIFIGEGVPDEPLEGGWPNGWIKRRYQRASGVSKGQVDRYWFSPSGFKFRSMNEIQKFMELLKTYEEKEAWAVFKGRISSAKTPTKKARTDPEQRHLQNTSGKSLQMGPCTQESGHSKSLGIEKQSNEHILSKQNTSNGNIADHSVISEQTHTQANNFKMQCNGNSVSSQNTTIVHPQIQTMRSPVTIPVPVALAPVTLVAGFQHNSNQEFHSHNPFPQHQNMMHQSAPLWQVPRHQNIMHQSAPQMQVPQVQSFPFPSTHQHYSHVSASWQSQMPPPQILPQSGYTQAPPNYHQFPLNPNHGNMYHHGFPWK